MSRQEEEWRERRRRDAILLGYVCGMMPASACGTEVGWGSVCVCVFGVSGGGGLVGRTSAFHWCTAPLVSADVALPKLIIVSAEPRCFFGLT